MRHPIVLISATAVLETCGVLLFPQYSFAFIISAIIAAVVGALLFPLKEEGEQ